MTRKRLNFILGSMRIAIIVALVLCQAAVIILLVDVLRNLTVWIYVLVDMFIVITMLLLVSRNENNSNTIAWVLLIALFPLLGFVLYIAWGQAGTNAKQNRRVQKSVNYSKQFVPSNQAEGKRLQASNPESKRISGYLSNNGFPVYQNTSCEYYCLGELQFAALLEDLKKAEHFIFIQTFILSEGRLWDELEEVLLQKAAENVEVRLLYDDFGSAAAFSLKRFRFLRERGIQVLRYNPLHKYTMCMSLNYRTHQKITVIDDKIAYTGGTNIADEYANYYNKRGHWRDTAIRLTGSAVWGLTTTFLQMWDAQAGEYTGYKDYCLNAPVQGKGFFQPFSDGPINNPQNLAETVYKEMISGAKEYLYITTPYLVIDNAMLDLLCATASSGVDVRMILPHMWDQWYVRDVSRSNYEQLISAGVKVYEYTPGFIHSKMILNDANQCVIGTINMDYRSFHHHFENAVWICESDIVENIKRDMLDTVRDSELYTLEKCQAESAIKKIVVAILRVFSIMM